MGEEVNLNAAARKNGVITVVRMCATRKAKPTVEGNCINDGACGQRGNGEIMRLHGKGSGACGADDQPAVCLQFCSQTMRLKSS